MINRTTIIIFLAFFFVALLSRAEGTTCRTNIEPLLTTNWHQGTPFNLEMGKRINWSVTGCTPTALAQIMKYYRYPNRGLRDMTYKFEDKILDYKLTQIDFKWDNMLDEYIEGNYTDAQANAVAELMFAISTTLPMNHSTYPFGSDPLPACEIFALEQIFGYDSGMQHLEHKHFDDETWENIIYYELSQGRPILFNGYGIGFGHAFICDGYKDGFFHLNFGWGSTDNSSYYSLDTLQSLKDGESMGFVYNQNITIGICPKGQNTNCNPYVTADPTLIIDSDFGQTFEFRPMCNVPYTCEVGVNVISSDGSHKVIKTNDLVIKTRHSGHITLDTQKIKSQLANGIYTITPVYRQMGTTNWRELLVPINKAQSAQLNVSTDRITITPNAPTHKANIQINSFTSSEEKIFSQQQNLFYIVADNSGNFQFANSVEMRFYDALNNLVATNYVYIYSHPKLPSTPSLYQIYIPVNPGSYLVQFVDDVSKAPISDLFAITVESEHSSVTTVINDCVDEQAEYFTIGGIRINESSLTKGIYIKRTSSKTEKIIIR